MESGWRVEGFDGEWMEFSSRERLILRLSLIVRRAFCSSVTESVPKISTLAKMKIRP